MVALGVEENLSLLLKSPESLGVGYPVHVALERGADAVLILNYHSADALCGSDSVFSNQYFLQFFRLFPNTLHFHTAFPKSYTKCFVKILFL